MVARSSVSRLCIFAVACLAAMPAWAHAVSLDDARPLAFEANHGQADARVRFVARGAGHTTFLTDAGATIAFPTGEGGIAAIEMRFEGGAGSVPRAGASLPGVVTYVRGEDDAPQIYDAATFERVAYQNVYPGIDAVFYGTPRALEYDFVVAPAADPRRIVLRFAGADAPALDAAGNLLLRARADTLTFRRPVAYQHIAGQRHAVPVRYELRAGGRVGLRVGRYDRRQPLAIDPVLVLSTNLWGATGVAADPAGNLYVTGSISSADLPVAGGYQTQQAGSVDAFVMKLDPAGKMVLYTTYLGARRTTTYGIGIAVDAAGSAYVTGTSSGTAYPVTPGAYQSAGAGFITKLKPAGNALAYSTRFSSAIAAIAVHADGSLAITGTAAGVVATPGAFQATGPGGAAPYIARLNPTGTAMMYATYVGGSLRDEAHAVAVDAAGNAYIAGVARSSDFPTRAPLRAALSGGSDAFLAKVNPTGTALVYSTYLGGSADERGFGVTVDGAGEATVVGWTTSFDFPVTPGVFQPRIGVTSAGLSNAFITRFDASGTALRWSTYLGGGWCAGSGQSSCFGIFGPDEGIDVATSVANDAAGFTYVGGYATSTRFPLVDRLQDFGAGGDVQRAPFVARIRPGASRLAYSVVLGPRTATTNLNQIAIDGQGGVVALGNSPDPFPLTAGAVFGEGQSFVFKLAPGSYPTTLRSSADPAQRGQMLLLVADSDSGANGSMTFRDGGAVLGTAPVQNGSASLSVTLAPGVHRLTATHSADGKPSPPVYQRVAGQ